MGVYGIWYSIFAKQFNRFPGLRRLRYEPRPYQRVLTFAGSLIILVVGFTELMRLWKSN
jgi:hypothetical protein